LAKGVAKQQSKHSPRNLVPATFGSSLGTLFLLLVKNLSDHNPAKSWLIIASPTVAVIITWLTKLIDKEIKKAKVGVLQEKLKIKINQAIQNPSLTDKKRQDYQQILIDIEKITIENLANQIKDITAQIHS
jgi:hypothetical protein